LPICFFSSLPELARTFSVELFAAQKAQRVFRTYLTVAQDLMQEARSDCLSRVHRHHRAPPIFMAKKMVAAADAHNRKSGTAEGRDQFSARDARASAHAAITTR
jgi:hypothetical protein